MNDQLGRAIAALVEIRDAYWPDGQPQGDKVNCLKEIAADALRHLNEIPNSTDTGRVT